MRNTVKEVLFEQEDVYSEEENREIHPEHDKTILLNCSLRGRNANSEKFLTRASARLNRAHKYLRVSDYHEDQDTLIDQLMRAETLVLAMPFYVDGLSSTVIRLLEKLEKAGPGEGRKIYILANLGLYESHQLKNLFAMIRYWCTEADYSYSGGIAIGAGELIGVLIEKMKSGLARDVSRALAALAEAVDTGKTMEDLYVQPMIFPRWLYIRIANYSWVCRPSPQK